MCGCIARISGIVAILWPSFGGFHRRGLHEIQGLFKELWRTQLTKWERYKHMMFLGKDLKA